MLARPSRQGNRRVSRRLIRVAVRGAALPPRLEQADAGRDRDVERRDRTGSGIATSRSHNSRVSRRRPVPSAPSTQASGPDRSASNRLSVAAASAPSNQTPRSLRSRSVRARLVTAMTRHRVRRARRRLGDGRVDTDRAILRARSPHARRTRRRCAGTRPDCADRSRRRAPAAAAVRRVPSSTSSSVRGTAALRRLPRRRPDAGRSPASRIEALFVDRCTATPAPSARSISSRARRSWRAIAT